MKLCDLPRKVVMVLGPWPEKAPVVRRPRAQSSHAIACQRYREKNLEACRARVRASKAKRRKA